jgi:outer membrane protein assembly factor BamB
MGGGSGSSVTAGGLLFRGEPDGNFVAVDAKTGEVLWKFQTGFGTDAPPIVYEIDGDESSPSPPEATRSSEVPPETPFGPSR